MTERTWILKSRCCWADIPTVVVWKDGGWVPKDRLPTQCPHCSRALTDVADVRDLAEQLTGTDAERKARDWSDFTAQRYNNERPRRRSRPVSAPVEHEDGDFRRAERERIERVADE